MTKSCSLEEGDRPRPYTVTGHTILKNTSIERHSQSVDHLNKHASFNEDVEVMPFDRKSKCVFISTQGHILHARLQDDLENLSDSSWSESLTDQEIPESDEDNYTEDIIDSSAKDEPTVFNLDSVPGEDATEDKENSSPSAKDNLTNSPKLVKQNSDEGLPAPKKSKVIRGASLDTATSVKAVLADLSPDSMKVPFTKCVQIES